MRKTQEDFGKLWELNATWNHLTPSEKEFIDLSEYGCCAEDLSRGGPYRTRDYGSARHS